MDDIRIERLRKNAHFLANTPEELAEMEVLLTGHLQLYQMPEAGGWNNLLLKPENDFIPFHRKNNPFEEWSDIRQASDEPAFVVGLGTGMGYQVPFLLTKSGEMQEFILVETDIEPLFMFLTEFELDKFLPEKTRILYAPSVERLTSFLEERLFRYHPSLLQLLALESFEILNPGYAAKIVETVQDSWTRHLIYLNSLEIQKDDVFSNVINNIPTLLSSHLFDEGCASDQRALIVASGPSSEYNMPIIRALKEEAHLIVLGSAMHPLVKNGIEPDFVIIVDPNPINLRHFPEDKYPYPLIFDPVIPAGIVQKFTGPKFVCNIGHSIVELMAMSIPMTRLVCWGTVSSSALAFCKIAGFSEIAFTGIDFSFPANKTHVADYLLDTRDAEVIETIDITGRKVNTVGNFVDYATFFDKQVLDLGDEGSRLFNCCEGGLLKSGEKISLREYFHQSRKFDQHKKSLSWKKHPGMSQVIMKLLREDFQNEYLESEKGLQHIADGILPITSWANLHLVAAFEGFFLKEAERLEEAVIAHSPQAISESIRNIKKILNQKKAELMQCLEGTLAE